MNTYYCLSTVNHNMNAQKCKPSAQWTHDMQQHSDQ